MEFYQDKKVKRYDDSIEMAIANIDLFDTGSGETFYNEWKEVREYKTSKIIIGKELEELKKKYLKKILEYEKDEPEYEFYKIILEYLGIDEYVLESEIQNIKESKKTVK